MAVKLIFETDTPDELQEQVTQMAGLLSDGRGTAPAAPVPAGEKSAPKKRGPKPKAAEPEAQPEAQPEAEDKPGGEVAGVSYEALLEKMSVCVNAMCADKKGADKTTFVNAKKAAFAELLANFETESGEPVLKLKELPEASYAAMAGIVDKKLAETA